MAFITVVLAGCAIDRPINPTFRLTLPGAAVAWREMEANPKPLERPIVVLAGWSDPGIVSGSIAERMRRVSTDRGRVIHITFMRERTFEECAAKVVRIVQNRFPSHDLTRTVEVDVIGFSMGGLVARFAARPHNSAKRSLCIHRLFTIGTPHVGARMAWWPSFDPRVADMRFGSRFLKRLNDQPCPYVILPYVRLGDFIVGAENAAPPGRHPWWVSRGIGLSHMMAGSDLRILADIARRVRGERPFTREPASPVPLPHPTVVAGIP